MKDITVSELKKHLSKYLRMASQGTIVVVKDRDDPVAQLTPLEAAPGSWRERLAREGRLRLGTQRWSELRISKPLSEVNIQEALRSVREDPV